MGAWIRSLHPAVEFAVVVLIAFGPSVIGSLQMAQYAGETMIFDGAMLRSVIINEIVMMLLLGWFLLVRRWDFTNQPLYPSWIETLQGLMFCIGTWLAWSLVLGLLFFLLPLQMNAAAPPESGEIGWITLLLACIINPVFEELFVCAYVISSLRKPLGTGIAVAVSVAIRAAYHTYQGAPGFFAMGVMGIIFGIWFARTNRLWPLIIAHAVMDFVPLVSGTLE